MVQERKEKTLDILFISIIIITTLSSWNIVKDLLNWWTYYWQFSPNAFRYFEQLLLYINTPFFTITAMSVWSWLIFLPLTYLIIRPQTEDSVLFLLWNAWQQVILEAWFLRIACVR